MKPPLLLLFFLIVSFVLVGLQFILPKEIQLYGHSLKVFQFSDWLHETQNPGENLDVEKLLKLQVTAEKLVENGRQEVDMTDSLQTDTPADSTKGGQILASEFHIDSTSGIQFPAGDSTILQSFFMDLDSLRQRGELARILHFGDSQIEGDRITGYLRQRFQQRYGGCGPGLVPLAEEEPSRFSVEMQTSQLPTRYVLYGKPTKGPHNQYSVLHSVFRLKADSSRSGANIRQSFSYKLRSGGYQKSTYFEQGKLLLHNSSSPIDLDIRGLENQVQTRTILPNDSIRLVEIGSQKRRNTLNFRINSDSKNDFYGVCLDCKSGLAIDNIPLRGSSGMELLKINPQFLKEQIRLLNVKLVILQFGVNVVPYESKGYTWYENALVRIIRTIKQAKPDVQVLVVGVSDMAHKVNGEWQSFDNIELVKAAQYNAARKTNAAFWDLQKVMGGQNAIVAWAGTVPALAGKDYVHLTPKGAQVIGEFLFQALIRAQKKYDVSL